MTSGCHTLCSPHFFREQWVGRSRHGHAHLLEELVAAFEEHLEVTEQQIERLEKVFKIVEKAARGKHCAGMEGLIKEGSELIKDEDSSPALDAALICAAQKVEHYEIAAYGSLVEYAKLLELDDAIELLEETLGKLGAFAEEQAAVVHVGIQKDG